MKKGLKVFLVIFIVFAILGGALALAYLNNSFPVFNEFVDSVILGKIVEDVEIETIEEIIETPKEKLPVISNHNFFVLSKENIKKLYVSEKIEDYDVPNVVVKLSEDCYSIMCEGDFIWEKTFSFPVISSFTIYENSLGLITANNSFVLLNLKDGSEVSVLPLEMIVKADLDYKNQVVDYGFYPKYDFVSETDEKMSIILDESKKYFTIAENPDSTYEENQSLKDLFMPSKEAQNFILSRIESFGASIDKNNFPKLEFFLEDGEYSLEDDAIRFFIYQPKKAGKYTIGLTNENGAFVNDNAVVAVFKEDGSLVEVSLGYVANEPNVSVYLENENYYVVAYRIFVDESSLKEVYLSSKKAL